MVPYLWSGQVWMPLPKACRVLPAAGMVKQRGLAAEHLGALAEQVLDVEHLGPADVLGPPRRARPRPAPPAGPATSLDVDGLEGGAEGQPEAHRLAQHGVEEGVELGGPLDGQRHLAGLEDLLGGPLGPVVGERVAVDARRWRRRAGGGGRRRWPSSRCPAPPTSTFFLPRTAVAACTTVSDAGDGLGQTPGPTAGPRRAPSPPPGAADAASREVIRTVCPPASSARHQLRARARPSRR